MRTFFASAASCLLVGIASLPVDAAATVSTGGHAASSVLRFVVAAENATPVVVAKRGADDPPGDVRRGRGTDDPVGGVRRNRGSDDPVGDLRRSRGADDPAGDARRGGGADNPPGDRRGRGRDVPSSHI